MELEKQVQKFFFTGSVESARNILNECIKNEAYELAYNFSKLFFKILPFDKDLYKIFLKSFKFKPNIQFEISEKLSSLILDRKEKEEILKERSEIIPEIENEFIFYNFQKVSEILEKPKSPFGLVTFSITTCKRLNLFEQTMNSFLNCCQDINKIDRWICVDDNSSEEDRARMKKLYPFFDFFFKNTENKGHAKSMDIIINQTSTPYLFHMEDDWKFISKRNYISDCIDVLNHEEKIGQCLINRSYAEISSGINICIGNYEKTTNNTEFIRHNYGESEKDQINLAKIYGGGQHCWYWPHFSLRPGLWKISIMKSMQPFYGRRGHFEMEYAREYVSKGYITAFLNTISCLHIGRLTSERHGDKPNAYVLNDESQFCSVLEQKVHIEPFVPQPVVENKPTTLRTFVINLNRRPDRWENIKKLEELKFLKYGRFPAVDGKSLVPTERLQRIFDGNDYRMKAGMVGCALSHIALYTIFLESEWDVMCVLEDDIQLVPGFQEKFTHIYGTLSQMNWDLCYLGHHIWPHHKEEKFFDKIAMPKLLKTNTQESLAFSMGGTTGYLITKEGAKKLLNFLNNGLTNAIDTMQQKAADIMNVYYTIPLLIYSTCIPSDNHADSDIHKDNIYLCLPIEERCSAEMKLYDNPVLESNEKKILYFFENPDDSTMFVLENAKEIQKLIQKIPQTIQHYVMRGQISERSVLVLGKNLLPYYRLKKGDRYDISVI